ncbi:MAG: double zinc ribbon domain-containing protein [Pseudomonadales bacterium]
MSLRSRSLTLLTTLFPGACLCCGAWLAGGHQLALCRWCLAALPWNVPSCLRCAVPLASPANGPDTCARCTRRSPPYQRTIAPLRFEGAPAAWVRKLKDRSGMVEGRLLGQLLAIAARDAYDIPAEGLSGIAPPAAPAQPPAPVRPEVLVPVPLSLRRLAWRGHNQALSIARPLQRALDVPMRATGLCRRHQAGRQRGRGRTERHQQIRGLFRSRRDWQGAVVGLVDDVVTTGATAAEVARTLLESGAREVHVLAATRTPPHVPAGADAAASAAMPPGTC